jgi:predicted Fe-Mo cluster-binding NifX family protein
MKIAVPVTNENQIDGHFGHCDSYGVTVMLAAAIGGGAVNVLNNSGIEVVLGCSDDATEVVKRYLARSVEDGGSSCHKHSEHHEHIHDHGHDHGHQCSHN